MELNDLLSNTLEYSSNGTRHQLGLTAHDMARYRLFSQSRKSSRENYILYTAIQTIIIYLLFLYLVIRFSNFLPDACTSVIRYKSPTTFNKEYSIDVRAMITKAVK